MRGGITIRQQVIAGLHAILAGSILLLIVLYYLGDDGQASFFPSYLLTLACLALLAFPGGHHAALSDPRVIVALVLIAWLGASPLWSGSFDWQYPGYAALLATFVAGFMMAEKKYPALIDWVITVTILAAAISAAVSVYLFYFIDYNPLDEKDRLFALGRNYQPTISAISYSIPLVMAAARLAFQKQPMVRAGYVVALVPLIWAVALTGTRGAWLGLGAALVASAIILFPMSWRLRGIAAAGLVAALAAGVGIAMALGFDDYILRRSTSFRPEIWGATIERITAGNWLLGNGINVSAAVNWQHLRFDHAHSIYLSTMFYGGVVGFGLLMVLLAMSGLPLVRKAMSERHAIAFATLAFAVITLAVDGNRLIAKVDHLWIAFWLPLMIGWIAVTPRGRAAG